MYRVAVGLMWLGLLAVMWIRPPDRPDLPQMLVDLMLGRFRDYEPLVACVFWSLGLWPAAWLVALRDHLRGWPPAWPFIGGSFVLGGYALLPWFPLGRRWSDRPTRPALAFLGHPGVGATLTAAALLLALAALVLGSPLDYLVEFRIDGFTFAMTFDFTALWITSILWAHAHRERAEWWLAIVPLIGFCGWLTRAATRAEPASGQSAPSA